MSPPKKKKKPSTRVAKKSAAATRTPQAAVPTEEPMDTESPSPLLPTPQPGPLAEDGPTAGSSTPPRPPPASSPTKCVICLGEVVNNSFTNSCLHQFCFTCLRQWSEVKPECPLCKSAFQSIFYNIRSNDDYDEYRIARPRVPTLSAYLLALQT